ncbi:ubiquitin-like protein Pup [Corynebacterium uterequi]|uniref:Prokaryotic ubiquitin-like protein Pup n=1 Tax=Corynebacterium uterequi TaxID=1072256 RepID=A0A0G3HCN8_9CORY|nr:ubiquitin-like protein Pup [Corynebacterium uterequi]
MAQQQMFGSGGNDDASSEAQSAGQVHLTGADDLLDEIDSLLENNAEQFVRSYVQKGGQ